MSHVSRYLDPAIVEQLSHLQLSARSVVEGTTSGLHRSPVKGASVEFRQHRFYVPGDEPRRLDWRVLARTDRPYVKEYDEETNLRCVLMVDCSGSMSYGPPENTKFDFAARVAAALAYLMLGQTESVGVGMCGRKIETWLAPHADPNQLSRVLETLEACSATGPSQLADAMHQAAERLDRRSLVVIISDFFLSAEQLRAGLAHLRHDRHEVIAVQAVDRDEESFPFRTWCQFIGMEGEKSRLCEPAMVRKAYQENFQRHRRALKESCQALRVEFQSMTTEKSVLDAVRQVLSRRTR